VRKHLDLGSIIILLITLVLFIAALFVKGLTHDILLEAGVFLVSVKVIMMAYNISQHANEIIREIRELKDAMDAY
jgi:cobalamin biosynthesis protein CobD/CbiB